MTRTVLRVDDFTALDLTELVYVGVCPVTGVNRYVTPPFTDSEWEVQMAFKSHGRATKRFPTKEGAEGFAKKVIDCMGVPWEAVP